MDETDLSLHPPLHKCWMKRGQQKTIPTPGTTEQYHLFGALDWLDDSLTWLPAEHKTSASFIEFLEHLLLERYPSECVVLVLDNASIHKSRASLAALSLFEHRVLVFWLPPYCSTLNPIERFWEHLKDQVCVDTLYPDMRQLIASVEHELSCQNDLSYPERLSFSK
jgi:transposase